MLSFKGKSLYNYKTENILQSPIVNHFLFQFGGQLGPQSKFGFPNPTDSLLERELETFRFQVQWLNTQNSNISKITFYPTKTSNWIDKS